MSDGRTQEAAEGTGPPRLTPAITIPAIGEPVSVSSPVTASNLDRRDRSLKALLVCAFTLPMRVVLLHCLSDVLL